VIYAEPLESRVRGDWMPEGETIPAQVRATWNGWAEPWFDRAGAEAVVEAQLKLAEDGWPEAPAFTWDGDVLVMRDVNTMTEEELAEGFRIEPDDGWYNLGLGWTWEHAPVEGADPGAATEAQAEAFKRLMESLKVHSHDRMVLPDGRHRFPVQANLGRKSEHLDREGNPLAVHETVAWIEINPEGEVSLCEGLL